MIIRLMTRSSLVLLANSWLVSTLVAAPASSAGHPKLNLRSSGVSSRDLVSSRLRLSPVSGGFVRPAAPSADADSLHVLVLMVEFEADTLEETTGDGRFQRAPEPETSINRAPHDQTYFDRQMQALAHYYGSVSDARLVMSWDIYPEAPATGYQLGREMAYYAPDTTDPVKDRRLAELLRDAVLAADESGAVDFGPFESLVVFHAGVGADFDLGFDPTPNDVPSVFFNRQDLDNILGGPITVNGGANLVEEGIILPETQTQEGIELGLLGTAAIMFGHQIGLPNLFNTDNGTSGIGRWGLMDQGSGNFLGMLPAEPCAWSKVYLGWVDPIEVRQGENLPAPSGQVAAGQKIYKVPITNTEYYLIENRQRDYDSDGFAQGEDARGVPVRFNNEGLVEADSAVSVIVSVDDYDFGLPGSGILIWHIDEAVIAQGLAANRVNANPDRRGVDLEEADGAQDLGQLYGFIDPGAGSENGVWEDAFWASNEINLKVNGSEAVEFGAWTSPDSKSNDGGVTNIRIFGFSELDSVMHFSVETGLAYSGFPGYTEKGANSVQMAVEDLERDGARELIIATRAGDIFAWHHDGTPVIANDEVLTYAPPYSLPGTASEASFQSALFTSIKPYLRGPFTTGEGSLTLGDLDGDADLEVIYLTNDGKLFAWHHRDDDGDARADSLVGFPVELGHVVTHPVMVFRSAFEPKRDQIVIGTIDGRVMIVTGDGQVRKDVMISDRQVYLAGLPGGSSTRILTLTENGVLTALAADGESIWSRQYSGTFSRAPISGDLDGDGVAELALVSREGALWVTDSEGKPVDGFPRQLGSSDPVSFALGDVDADGLPEVLAHLEDRLWAVNHNGTVADDFPVGVTTSDAAQATSGAIVADPDGSGKAALVLSWAGSQMAAIRDGGVIRGFPQEAGAEITGLLAADLDLDGDVELIASMDDGMVRIWDMPGGASTIAWSGVGNGARRQGIYDGKSSYTKALSSLMPERMVYNYPNPAEGGSTFIRYTLRNDADVHIKVYDLAGDLVKEFDGPGVGKADNEVEWDLDGIASGVYLVRVEAAGERTTSVAIFKAAVVK